MFLSCPIKRHHWSGRGGNGAYQVGKTNRHGNYGELAQKVNFEMLTQFETLFIFSVRFDKNGSGKIAWENGKEELVSE